MLQPSAVSAGLGSTQNSLPSGSRMTTWESNRSTALAPSPSSRATSSSIEVSVRRSRCRRFFAVLGSGTRLNHMFGPPHAGASTNALSGVESSSTSDPRTAAQNRAWANASPQSKVKALTNRYTGGASGAFGRFGAGLVLAHQAGERAGPPFVHVGAGLLEDPKPGPSLFGVDHQWWRHPDGGVPAAKGQ